MIIALNKKLSNLLPSGIVCRAIILQINEVEKYISLFNIGFLGLYNSIKQEKFEELEMSAFSLGQPLSNTFKLKTLSFEEFDTLFFILDTLQIDDEHLSNLENELSFNRKRLNLNNNCNKVMFINMGHEEQVKVSLADLGACFSDHLLCQSMIYFHYTKEALSKKDLLMVPEKVIQEWMHPESTNLLLALIEEGFNNALEHGLLKLDSNIKKNDEGFSQYYKEKLAKLDSISKYHELFINLSISRFNFKGKNFLCIKIEDSGDGFNYIEKKSMNKQITPKLHGRGLMILKGISSNIFFNKKANILYIMC